VNIGKAVGLAAAAIGMAIFAGTAAIGTVFATANPGTSIAVAPNNGFAHAALADAALLTPGKKPDYQAAREHTFKALATEPGIARNVRTLGLLAADGKIAGDSARLIGLAHRLSKRDLPASLWLIEHYSAKGDVQRTLDHYDIALRTSEDSEAILFPVLFLALGDDEIVAALVPKLNRNPLWAHAFWRKLLAEPKLPRLFVRLAEQSRFREGGYSKDFANWGITKLVSEARLNDAYRLFAYREPRAYAISAGTIHGFDRHFDGVSFRWQYHAEGGRYVEPQSDRSLIFGQDSGDGGLIARKLVRLPPGQYRLVVTSERVAGDANDNARFELLCDTGRRRVALVPFATRRDRSTVSTRFEIPTGCAYQWLDLLADRHMTPQTTEFVVQPPRIERVR